MFNVIIKTYKMKMQGISKKLTRAEKKKLKSLHTKKGRAREKQFVAEGVRLLEDSLRHKWLPEKAYYAKTIISDRGRRLIGRLAHSKVAVEAVSAEDMKQISDAEASQGLVCIFRMPEYDPEEVYKDTYRRILILDNVSDPGNAGTLIRSAGAFGFDLVLITPDSVEPFNPKVVRASAGAVFGLPVMIISISQIIKSQKRKKMKLIVGDLKGIQSDVGLRRMRLGKNFMLAIGSESTGVSPKLRESADIRFKINHDTRVESLNAAVAGSIIMKELYDRFLKKSKR